MNKQIIDFIRSLYPEESPVPLHAPRFRGNEKRYLEECINSTFVSYVGEFVARFERELSKFTGSKKAVATNSGTSALHTALILLGVKPGDLVLTQALSFVATSNAIAYTGAEPVFIDCNLANLGMEADSLNNFLGKCETRDDGKYFNGKRIAACLPVHIFGHPCDIETIQDICSKNRIPLLEDAAEALGSFKNGKHVGTFGSFGVLSFNGNKVITTGGGGMLLTNNDELAERARFITTTAKMPHKYFFRHSEIGYNYRMPNINAAIGLAQLETLSEFLDEKREVAGKYRTFFESLGSVQFQDEPIGCKSNFWLNSILFMDRNERDSFLEFSNENKVMTRPAWELLNTLPMFSNCYTESDENAKYLYNRIVALPSSAKKTRQ